MTKLDSSCLKRGTPTVVALAALAVASFSPLVHAPLLFDDHSVVESDPAVRHVDANGRVDVDVFEDLWSRPRPLRQLTHRVDLKLFGDGTFGPHAENIALHILVGLAGFALLRRLGLGTCTAWTAAAIFLVNPVCVESVGILSHRKEILAALFLLAGLFAAVRRPERVSPVALACFLLAVCAKETAATYPAFVAMLFLYRRRTSKPSDGPALQPSKRQAVRTLAIYCVFAAVMAAISWLQIRHSMASQGGNPASDAFRAGHFGPDTALATAISAALRSVPRWAMSLAWPFGHTIDPDFDLRRPLLSRDGILAAASAAIFTAILIRAWRTGSRLFTPMAWCCAALVPYLWPPFIQSGATQVLADRYAYLPSFGAAWLAAQALETVTARKWRAAASAAIIAMLGISTFALARDYTSEVALWTRARRLNPWSFQAAHNLAMAFWRENHDAAAADAEFEAMTDLEPEFDYGICSRAQVRAEAGAPMDALALLDGALRDRPRSRQLLRQRGIVRFGLGRLKAACEDFAEAEKLGAGDSFFRRRYGEALIRMAHWREARRQILLAGNRRDSRREAELSFLLVSDPPLRRGGVLIAGDSLPHGTAAVDAKGLEHGLAALLPKLSGLPAKAFADTSVPGSRAAELPASVRKAVRTAPQPAVCVIWSGHNDAFFGADAETILRSLASAALECRKAGVRPVIVGPIPVRSAPGRDRVAQELTLAQLDERLRDFCMEAGMGFVSARGAIAAAFPEGIGEVIDPATGNHLLLPGMEAVARKVAAAVKLAAK